MLMTNKTFDFSGKKVFCEFGGKSILIKQMAPLHEKTEIICKSFEKTLDSTAFFINLPSFLQYYVWFDKENEGKDPAIPGKTGIHIKITKTDTDLDIATKIAAGLDTVEGFTCSVVGNIVTVECDEPGQVYPPEAYTSGYKLNVLTKGTYIQVLYNGQLWNDCQEIKDVVLYEDGSVDVYFTMTKTYSCKINRAARYDINKQFFIDNFRQIPAGWITFLPDPIPTP